MNAQKLADFLNLFFGPGAIQSFQVFWQGVCLNPAASGPKADLNQSRLENVIHDLWGPLSWAQLLLLQKHLDESSSSPSIDMAYLIELSGFQPHPRQMEALVKLSKMPPAFLSWANERKVSPQDLMPLMSLKMEHLIATQWGLWGGFQATRSQGRQLIDLITDLTLIQGKLPVWSGSEPVESLLETLKKDRYPQQTQRDHQAQKQMSAQAWPKFTQVRSLRQGDRLRHQIQLHFDDMGDLKQKIDRLKNHIKQNPEELA